MSSRDSRGDGRLRASRTFTVADVVLTVLVFAVGLVFVILTIRSVPAWWTTKHEWPPPTANTLALASAAGIAFFIAWMRCTLFRYSEPEMPSVSWIGNGCRLIAAD